ncbi:hypothetical protein CDN99_12180 [Roseateles aquatilis]|uniref:Uncharacterized protein n=1 Tax=Roseateles aquatilis TaxID=431061 RepID=A0A246JEB5_9BURK|nr:hypothetical protein [Roseateles aquatilis]OWQ90911.1 hypothetical protein CDN99_12180 [Roseateles aquatilis]
MKVNKRQANATAAREHATRGLPDDLLRFSFRHLHATCKFGLEQISNAAGYLPHLLRRLQSISSMRPKEFLTNKDKSLRAHAHEWARTTEKLGYALPAQWQSCPAWQFQLSANEHGRVHGILVDEVFYVVWLDPEHRLHP